MSRFKFGSVNCQKVLNTKPFKIFQENVLCVLNNLTKKTTGIDAHDFTYVNSNLNGPRCILLGLQRQRKNDAKTFIGTVKNNSYISKNVLQLNLTKSPFQNGTADLAKI